ncbi:MAG: hypothetical protein R6V62_01620 [Candidatus Fermentibacteraceae bacterium]
MKAATITVWSTLTLLLSASGCGGSPRSTAELSQTERVLLEETGGVLARNLAFPPGSANWREAPSESVATAVTGIAARVPSAWTVLFRSASDTLARLESPYQGIGYGDTLGQGVR